MNEVTFPPPASCLGTAAAMGRVTNNDRSLPSTGRLLLYILDSTEQTMLTTETLGCIPINCKILSGIS